MRKAEIHRFERARFERSRRLSPEHGVTMVLVALAMVAVIAMAALSIDVITIYLAREEAQRSADTAALAAARVISLSGITGDPNNTTSSWQAICGDSSKPASQAASAVALQNMVGGSTANTVTVTYGATAATDCSTLVSSSPNAFSTNPTVTVQVQRTNLPNFFSRIWSRSGTNVSASATAEVFNSSYSGAVGSQVVPVRPACVKPWLVPNRDPWSPKRPTVYCDQAAPGNPGPCNPIVNVADGTIGNPGISLNGTNAQGVIGERFWLLVDCHHRSGNCQPRDNPARANYTNAASPFVELPPNLEYVPGQVLSTAFAVPSCGTGSTWETAVAGCDQSTAYQCGVQSSSAAQPTIVDLRENPAISGSTTDGLQCLIHEGDPTVAQPDGQDTLSPYGRPSSYPFQILAGGSNPLAGGVLNAGSPITGSSSIVSLPIYDDSGGTLVLGTATTPVTIVGFLQVFVNAVDPYGNVDVTVLNVVGCSNGAGGNPYSVGASSIAGTSPVPIRLITPP